MNTEFRVVNSTAIRSNAGIASLRGEPYSGIVLTKHLDGFFKPSYFVNGVSSESWLTKYGISDGLSWVNEEDSRLDHDKYDRPIVDGQVFYGVEFSVVKDSISEMSCLLESGDEVYVVADIEYGASQMLYRGKDWLLEETKAKDRVSTFKYSKGGDNPGLLSISSLADKSSVLDIRGYIDRNFTESLKDKRSSFGLSCPMPTEFEVTRFGELPLKKKVSLVALADLFLFIGMEKAHQVIIETSNILPSDVVEIERLTKAEEVSVFCEDENFKKEVVYSLNVAYPNVNVTI